MVNFIEKKFEIEKKTTLPIMDYHNTKPDKSDKYCELTTYLHKCGYATKCMTRRLFVPGKWLPARSYDRATNPLFELSPPLSPPIFREYPSPQLSMYI